ncbi:hypothetical protein AD428_09230 [Achromobacter sp. DMS1]|nr:hypothetical protein AD428_09230 [Achromobacter sp. DMS1]
MHVQGAVLDDAGADGDGHVHFAAVAEVAGRAAVDAAAHGLELVDDLHGLDLGRAGERAGGEGRAQHVHAAHARVQVAGDVGHQVHDVRVALDDHGVADFHRAYPRHAAHVVAGQVDQHDVLGDFLGIGPQLRGQGGVFLGRAAALARAGQGTDGDLGFFLAVLHHALLAHQDLRRGAHHLEVAEVPEVHVGGGVEGPQGAVEGEGRVAEGLGDDLADLHLHEVAGGDVFLGPAHGGEVVLFLEVAPLLGLHAGVAVGNVHGAAQAGAQVVQALLGAAVGLGLGRVGVHHEVDAAGQVVDDDQLVHVHQHQVGRAAFHAGGKRLDGRAEAGLDVAHGVVAEVARQAAAEARHARTQRHPEAGLVLLDEGQRVALVGFGDLAVDQHLGEGALARITVRAGRPMNE